MAKQSDLQSKKNTDDYWRAQTVAYKESGLSIRVFCQKNQLRHSQFQYWLYKFRRGNKQSITKRQSRKSKKFIPVDIIDKPTSITSKAIVINFGNGRLSLECSGLSHSQIPELMKLIGGWHAQSNNGI